MDLLKRCVVLQVAFLLIPLVSEAKLTKSQEYQAKLLQANLYNWAARSQYKPLPAYVRKGVEVAKQQLEQIQQKDPENVKITQGLKEIVENIKYAAPMQQAPVEEKKGPSPEEIQAREEQERLAAAQRKKMQEKEQRKREQLKKFIQHLEQLNLGQWDEKLPNGWLNEGLIVLKQPELFGVTLSHSLNAASALLKTVVDSYDYKILKMLYSDNKKDADNLETAKRETVNQIIDAVLNHVYVPMLLVKGAFWDTKTKDILELWQTEVLFFSCYALRYDHSQERVITLLGHLMVAVESKYRMEGLQVSEETKVWFVARLTQCQQVAQREAETKKTKQQTAKENFKKLMDILKTHKPTTDKEETDQDVYVINYALLWLESVSSDQLIETAGEIKKMYNDAIYVGWAQWLWGAKIPEKTRYEKIAKMIDGHVGRLVAQREGQQGEPAKIVPGQGVQIEGQAKIEEPVFLKEETEKQEQEQEPVVPKASPAPTQEEKPAVVETGGVVATIKPGEQEQEGKKEKVRIGVSSYMDRTVSNPKTSVEEIISKENMRIQDDILNHILHIFANNNISYNSSYIEDILKDVFEGKDKYSKYTIVDVVSNSLKRLTELSQTTE